MILPGKLQRQLAGRGYTILHHLELGGSISDETGQRVVGEFVDAALRWPEIRDICESHSFTRDELCLMYTSMVEGLAPNPCVRYGAKVLLPTVCFVEHDELETTLENVRGDGQSRGNAEDKEQFIQRSQAYAQQLSKFIIENYGEAHLSVMEGNLGGLGMPNLKRNYCCLIAAIVIVLAIVCFIIAAKR